MIVTIIPCIDHLKVKVDSNTTEKLELNSSVISTLYAPWPETQNQGFAELEIKGNTLRSLLEEIGARYKSSKVDFEPICPITYGLKPGYDVFVNGRNSILLDSGLESELIHGDEVKILGDTMGGC